MPGWILTPDEMLNQGLGLFGIEVNEYISLKGYNSRFNDLFGSSTVVCSNIWQDLHYTDLPEARLDDRKASAKEFLLFLYFLKTYPTEVQLTTVYRGTEKTCRKWIWYFSKKVQALKKKKVS